MIEHHRAIHGTGAVLSIDLGALCANYALLAARAMPARCAAVVKADAYGLGARSVATALYSAGCRDFFVAHLGEALSLRRAIPGDGEIYVLNGLQPGGEAPCMDAGVIPVLNGLEQIEAWVRTAESVNRRLPAALQIDTGMSRLGLSPSEIDFLSLNLRLLDALDVRLVMSHLACADEPDHPANAEQLATLRRTLPRLPNAPVSLANSGAILLDPDYRFDLVRPGIALYGVSPTPGIDVSLYPVARLDARVVQLRDIPAGTAIGYGAAFRAAAPMRVATVSIGYADGWPRCLGDRGAAFAHGIRLPIVGRVSMDSLTVDVSALPSDALRLGSLVEMIGPNQTLDQIAAMCGTIPYEILTGLGHRFDRRYLGAVGGEAAEA